jgi:hypothetical protein
VATAALSIKRKKPGDDRPALFAAIDGRLPHGMGVARLIDLPAEWPEQHEMLGLPSH